MMVKVGLAIGIGVIMVLSFCFLCWVAWKLRHCMRAKQIFASHEEIRVENRKGLKKEVVRAFPVVKTSDLNANSSSKLQCPICWLAFRDGEVMRQLPHCAHVFHRHCIDPVLEQQIICPVCGTSLTDSPNAATDHRRGLIPKSDGSTPSWVLVNRPVPLPQSALVESGSSSSDMFDIELKNQRGEAPLLKNFNDSHDAPDWNDEQKCIDISFTFGSTDIPVEARQASTAAKDVDSFSFSIVQELASEAAAASNFRSQLRRSRGRESTSFSTESSSTRFSRSTSRSSRVTSSSSDASFQKWEFAHPEHLPSLTTSPAYCSFDVLPVITGSGTNRNTTYSQL